jgi:hypothetical protein
LADAQGTNAKLNTFWYGTGDKDPVFVRAQAAADRVYEGGLHTWPIWRRCLSEFVPLIFQGKKSGA